MVMGESFGAGVAAATGAWVVVARLSPDRRLARLSDAADAGAVRKVVLSAEGSVRRWRRWASGAGVAAVVVAWVVESRLGLEFRQAGALAPSGRWNAAQRALPVVGRARSPVRRG